MRRSCEQVGVREQRPAPGQVPTEATKEANDLLLAAVCDERDWLAGEVERLERHIAGLERAAGAPRTVERFTDHAARSLAREGLVVIPGFLPPARCDTLREQLESTLGRIPDRWPYEDDAVIQKEQGSGYAELDTYGAMAASPRVVVNRRANPQGDFGMLDVFHVERLVPELSALAPHADVLRAVREAAGADMRFACLHLYVNDAVAQTRGYHVDTYSAEFKAFLYLTDVPDRSFGPYSYVRGSHRPDWRRFLNGRLARARGASPTEVFHYEREAVVDVLGSRGTLVIADQRGVHRGLPQAAGRRRLALVASFHESSE